MNGFLTSAGMKTLASSPARDAYAAIALPALPAVGIDSTLAPRWNARVTAADRPRALNELVGLSDSSLMSNRSSPSDRPSRGAWSRGVQPSPSETGCSGP